MASSSPKRRKTNGRNNDASTSEASVSSSDKASDKEFDVRAFEIGLRPRRACTTKPIKKKGDDSDADENGEDKDDNYKSNDSSSDSDSYDNGGSGKEKSRGSRGLRVGSKRGPKRSASETKTKKKSTTSHSQKASTKTAAAHAAPSASASSAAATSAAASSAMAQPETASKTTNLTGPRPVGRPPVSAGTSSVGTSSGNYRGGNVPIINPPNEMTPENMAAVTLANNLNTRGDVDLQTLYVKIDTASETGMSALIGWAKASDSNKVYFQCMFCPVIDKTARDIATHIRGDHSNVTFAVIKKVPPTNQLLFLYCRRCDYITVDHTSVWIHYAVHHDLPDMLTRATLADITPQPASRREVYEDDLATVFPFYKCSMCDFIATDNRYVAQHAIMNHRIKDVASDYNGCFVKVLKVNKPKVVNPTQQTYGEVASGIGPGGVELVGGIKPTTETFVCVMCNYVSFCRFLAVTHHLRVHTGKFIMYKCQFDQCHERNASPETMIQHLKTVHECGTALHRHMRCQVTVVEKNEDGGLREAVYN